MIQIRYWTSLVLFCIFSVLVSCSMKSVFRGVTDVDYYEDRLIFASIVQGSPFFVYLEIPRGLDKDALLFRRTQWEYEAWLFHKDIWKCFYVKQKREGKDPKKIVHPDKKVIAVWTEKDQLVFGMSVNQQEILVLTDPIYADRNRRLADAEIEYTLSPVKLYLDKKMISGSAFYQHIAYVGEIQNPSSPSRIEFLRNGTLCYLWDRIGDFWYIEYLSSNKGIEAFAATQDGRGGWEETYQLEVSSSESPTLHSESQDMAISWVVNVPAWRMEARVSRIQPESSLIGYTSSLDKKGQNGSMGILLERFPSHIPISHAKFYAVEGSVQIEGEKKAVYGIIQTCCPKAS